MRRFLVAVHFWWRTGPVRWYCKKFRDHQGPWSMFVIGAGVPRLGMCRRCYAIADVDYYNRAIYFD